MPRIGAGMSGGATPSFARINAVRSKLWNFLSDEQAATAIEYGLIAAGIAVAIIAVVAGLGTNLNATFTSVSSALK
jgi:pilus assembly protein Flp/PilA